MDRPACETCPFFYRPDPDDWGSCHRHAPRPVLGGFRRVDPGGLADLDPAWPLIQSEGVNFCAEHPDFPAYLASLKAAPPPPDPPVYDSIPEGAYVVDGAPGGFPLRWLGVPWD